MHEYTNPAGLFLKSYEGSKPEDMVKSYAHFLLDAAGISSLPVDLEAIFKRFGIRIPQKVPLKGQRGFLLKPDSGLIVVNETDKYAVQRFTVSHELMELLFSTYEHDNSWKARADKVILSKTDEKERLCELGAAELLMSASLFQPLVACEGISFESAKRLSAICQTSLIATIKRMVSTGLQDCVFIIWKYMHSSGEFVPSAAGYTPLFGKPGSTDPPRKLRILRVTRSPSIDNFIPSEKSIEEDTHIYRAYATGTFTAGYDHVNLGQFQGRCYTESMPFNVNEERHVMSIIYVDPEDALKEESDVPRA